MTDIIFYCPKCGAKLSAGVDEVGEEFECPVCGALQRVPGEKSAAPAAEVVQTIAPAPAGPPPSTKVIRVPKKKIVLSSREEESEDEVEEIEEEIEEQVAGSGLRVLAMAVGAVAVILCGAALTWVVFTARGAYRDWWQIMLTFGTIFLLSLIGVVVAVIAFRIERILALLELLEIGGDEED